MSAKGGDKEIKTKVDLAIDFEKLLAINIDDDSDLDTLDEILGVLKFKRGET